MDIFKRLTVVSSSAFIVLVTIATSGRLFMYSKHPAKSGTYQFVVDPAVKENFSKEMMDSLRVVIDEKRDPVNVLVLDIYKGTKAIIPSQKQIEAENFQPLQEFVDGNVRLIGNRVKP